MLYILKIFPIAKQSANAAISAHTTVGPTGVPARIETRMPTDEQTTDIIAAKITVVLKLLAMRIAESAGNIISAEISNEPTRRIASTIITAVVTAVRRLLKVALTPEARAKSSSKVTAKARL